MEVKIILKNNRLILVNKSDGNRAFKSFGKKDTEWGYLFEQFKKQPK